MPDAVEQAFGEEQAEAAELAAQAAQAAMAAQRQELEAEHHPRVAALGGPSFALEVAQGKPTAVVVGCENPEFAARLQEALSGAAFRVYTTDDVIEKLISTQPAVVSGLA